MVPTLGKDLRDPRGKERGTAGQSGSDVVHPALGFGGTACGGGGGGVLLGGVLTALVRRGRWGLGRGWGGADWGIRGM